MSHVILKPIKYSQFVCGINERGDIKRKKSGPNLIVSVESLKVFNEKSLLERRKKLYFGEIHLSVMGRRVVRANGGKIRWQGD